jgi:Spy/CpxP family protein refolding chaperone
MARSLVPVLSLAALLAACSHNSPGGSTIEPGAPNASVADGRGRGGSGGPGGSGRAEQALLRGITLSADQQQRVDAIRARYRSQMEQARQGSGGDRTQMRTMMEKQQAEIRAVLTPDQQVQFDQNAADARAQRGGGRPGGAPPE